MKEGITKVDFNFTNAGGGHTASVTSFVNPKSVEDGKNLGIVVGELGETNNFSNPRITKMLGNFICTSKTTSADATKKVVTRRYVDRTSLMLDSCVILVRGINCGPEGGREFEGSVPYFTEVKGSPLNPFRTQGPVRDGSVIYLGKIYNVESAANFAGVKISLVYQNKQLKEELSLNTDFVSANYKASPDLSQYDLKFGYTLSEFKSALNAAGIPVEGLSTSEKLLFETSGTLSSVISSIAGSLGYFWYINPKNGAVTFLNSEVASRLPIDSHVNTTDTNVLSASFTESTVFNKIVNAYTGTTERNKANPKDDDRPRPIFFKRCRFESYGLTDKAPLPVLAAFFSLMEQEEDIESFDKFAYFCTAIAKTSLIEKIGKEEFNLTTLYPFSPIIKAAVGNIPLVDFRGQLEGDIFTEKKGITILAKEAAERTKLKGMNRITNKFKYLSLQFKDESGDEVSIKKMPKPHTTELYSFLKTYFAIAGGVYVSNGYSDYKAERMEFSNSNNIVIVGPLKGDDKIEEIKELSSVATAVRNLSIKDDVTVKDLALLAQTEEERGKNTIGSPVKLIHDNFFIGLRALPKLEREGVDQKVDFSMLKKYYEIYDPLDYKSKLYIGSPTKGPKDIKERTLVKGIVNLIKQSTENFLNAVTVKKTVRLTYTRSKTRVNKTNEEGEEQEDDQIAEASESDQKIADLFDRYDLKYNSIESPNYSILNKLSLSSVSGSTAEMKVLQQIRGKYIGGFDKPQSSTRTFYGLHIPEFSPTMNSVSISVGNNGITTTVSESTIKLIPPEQSFMITEGMEALTPKSMLPKSLNARQRNSLGL
tara:strand:- start:14157 stop:16619 length:2463 start_codon:yes stop_codon:yes gene_type:complete